MCFFGWFDEEPGCQRLVGVCVWTSDGGVDGAGHVHVEACACVHVAEHEEATLWGWMDVEEAWRFGGWEGMGREWRGVRREEAETDLGECCSGGLDAVLQVVREGFVEAGEEVVEGVNKEGDL
jgi:hypothetical protein